MDFAHIGREKRRKVSTGTNDNNGGVVFVCGPSTLALLRKSESKRAVGSDAALTCGDEKFEATQSQDWMPSNECIFERMFPNGENLCFWS